MVRQRLLGVTASLHEYDGVTDQEPVHVWLRLDRSGYVKCHCAGSGDLALLTEKPYAPYNMQEHGRVLLAEDEPSPLAAHTGELIEAVERLELEPSGMPVGVLLTFQSGSVAVAISGDALVFGVWPEAFENFAVHAWKGG